MSSSARSRSPSHGEPTAQIDKQSPTNGIDRSPQSTEGPQDHTSTLAESIKNCGWDELLERYVTAIEEHNQEDDEVRRQAGKLYEILISWTQAASRRDEDRAIKRFKTQRQYVQNSEEKLEDQKKHYAEVIGAFESALALLNGGVKP